MLEQQEPIGANHFGNAEEAFTHKPATYKIQGRHFRNGLLPPILLVILLCTGGLAGCGSGGRMKETLTPKAMAAPAVDTGDIAETPQPALPGPEASAAERTEAVLALVMSSPLHASGVQDYINAHRKEYEELTLKYPEGVLAYLLSRFEAGDAEGLRGQIMMHMCKDLLGAKNNVTDETLSPQAWYRQLAPIEETKLPDFTPEYPEDAYESLACAAITQRYSKPESGFLVTAPVFFGAYEEGNKRKVWVTVLYERYNLHGQTLTLADGAAIPGAILFNRDDESGAWVFEQYLEIGTSDFPDGAYFASSIQKLCTMPVSGQAIEGLAERILADYGSSARQEQLMKNLKEHLLAHGQMDIAMQVPGGGLIPLTQADPSLE